MTKTFLTAVGLMAFTIATAQPPAMQMHYSQDFEGCAMPAGWRASTPPANCNSGWQVGTPSNLSSQYFPIDPNGSNCVAGINDDANPQNCTRQQGDTLFSPVIFITNNDPVFIAVDYFYFDGSYGGFQEDFKMYVSRDSGRTWQLAYDFPGANSWTTAYVDITSLLDPTADDTLMVAFVYSDGGGWEFGAVIDNFYVYTPYTLEVALTGIFTPSHTTVNTSASVALRITNLGSSPITSVQLTGELSQHGSSQTVNLDFSAQPLAPNTDTILSLTFSSLTLTQANIAETLTVYLQDVNGNYPDYVDANDTGRVSFFVAQEVFPRQALCEDFTNASCNPCAAFNPTFFGYTDTTRDRTAPIMYHVWWPGSNDPMYQFNPSDVHTRVNFYGVNGVPAPFTEGQSGFRPSLVRLHHAIQSVVSLEIFAQYTDSADTAITIRVVAKRGQNDLAKYAQLRGYSDVRLFVAVAEESVTYPTPPGSNGETFFPWVMRAMLPDANGTSMNLSQDSAVVSFTYSIDTTVIDKDSVYVIAWVQDGNTKEVLNAQDVVPAPYTPPPQPSAATVPSSSPSVKAYITGQFIYVIAEQDIPNAEVYVMTPDGRRVATIHRGPLAASTHQWAIPGSLPAGYYYLVVGSRGYHYVTGFSWIK